jgi:glycosyltransferase involved in cell wall biosynthesis
MTPHIVYWNNIPAPYMIDRFNAVIRRSSLHFEVWFSARTHRDRSWKVEERSWEFPYHYLPSLEGQEYPLALPAPLFKREAPDLLVTLYAAPSFVLGATLARQRGARVAFWAEPTQDAVIKRRRWKEIFKTQLFRTADGVLTTGPDGRSFVSRYGTSQERIFCVPHTIDYKRYAQASELPDGARTELRAALGLRGITFVYVGRLQRFKGLGYLLDAFGVLQRRSATEVSLLLVGDGPEESSLRARAEGLENVVFAGFHDEGSLPRLYAAGDVFVFPTLGDTFGLVVSEAMAAGLPVIATHAAGEIRERVVDGVNGFVVPPANSAELLDRMSILAEDEELRRQMSRAATSRVANESPDAWAQAFERAVDCVLSLPRNRRSWRVQTPPVR